jgi:chromosome segregation ATPase
MDEAVAKSDTRIRRMKDQLERAIAEKSAQTDGEIASLRRDIEAAKVSATDQIAQTVKDAELRAADQRKGIDAQIAALGQGIRDGDAALQKRIAKVAADTEELQGQALEFMQASQATSDDLRASIATAAAAISGIEEGMLKMEDTVSHNARQIGKKLSASNQELRALIAEARSESAERTTEVQVALKGQQESLSALTQFAQETRESGETHHSELLQLAATVRSGFSDVRTELRGETQRSVDLVGAEVVKLRQVVDAFKGDSEFDLPALIESLKLLKTRITDSLNQSEARVARLRSRVEETVAEMKASMETQIADVHTEIGRRAAKVEETVTAELNSQISDVSRNADNLAGRIAELEKSGELLTGKTLPELNERISGVHGSASSKFKAINREFAAVRDEVKVEAASLKSVSQAATDEVQRRVDDLNTKLGAATDDLRHGISTADAASKDRAKALSQELEELRGGSRLTIGKLAVTCTELQNAIAAGAESATAQVEGLQERVQREISRLKRDIKSLSGGSSVSLADAQQSIEALQESARELHARQAAQFTELVAQVQAAAKLAQELDVSTGRRADALESSIAKELETVARAMGKQSERTKSALADIESKSAAAEARFSKHARAEMEKLSQSLNDSVSELTEHYTTIGEEVRNLRELIGELSESQKSYVGAEPDREAELLQRVKQIVSRAQAKALDAQQVAFADLQNSLEAVRAAAIMMTSGEWASFARDLQGLKAAVRDIAGGSAVSIAELESNLQHIDEKITQAKSDMRKRIKEATNGHSPNLEQQLLDAVEARGDRLEKRIEDLEGKAFRSKADVVDPKGEMIKLIQSELARSGPRVDATKTGEIENLGNQIEQMQSQLDRLARGGTRGANGGQQAVDDLRNELELAVESVKAEIEALRESLDDRLSAVEGQKRDGLRATVKPMARTTSLKQAKH